MLPDIEKKKLNQQLSNISKVYKGGLLNDKSTLGGPVCGPVCISKQQLMRAEGSLQSTICTV